VIDNPLSRGRRPNDDFAFMERKLVTLTGPTGGTIDHLLRISLVRTPWFSIKLHKLLSSDTDRYLHDHPWHWFSLMLSGSYSEERPGSVKVHRPGSMRIRWASSPHRLTLLTPHVWTLFITGGRLPGDDNGKRRWGFHTPDGWRPYNEIVSGDVIHLHKRT